MPPVLLRSDQSGHEQEHDDEQDGDDDDEYIDRNSPDLNARFGRKKPKSVFMANYVVKLFRTVLMKS